MRLQEHSNKLETNLKNNETQEFSIGDASVVIDILRNRLYEHKIRTLVQEYICNARDAMRELGKDNEYTVTMPTSLSPVFKVRDFGPGISPERMQNVFIRYGASTKRDNNTQTGGFGIGAKSAWSYTDSFTITTFIDGTKRTYVAHTGVNNQGRLDQVAVDKTTEPNGTEIQVPVNKDDIHEFRESVNRAIYFWTNRPEVKGDCDTPELYTGLRLNDTVELIDGNNLPEFVGGSRYHREMLAIIDGVPYTINDKLVDKSKKLQQLRELSHKRILLHFGNGVVEVSASRESIADSKLTMAALEKLATKAIVAIKTHVSQEFGKVNSTAEFFQTYADMARYFHVDNFAKYGEYQIRNDMVSSELFGKVKITHIHNIGRRNRVTDKIYKEDVTRNELQVKNIQNLYFLSGDESAIRQNKRIRDYLKFQSHMYLIEKKGDDTVSYDKMVSDFGAKDFLALTWTEVPREAKTKIERDKEEFCVHVPNGYNRHEYMTIAGNQKEWLYVPLDGVSFGNYQPNELADLSEFLESKEQKTVCGLSPKALKMVENDSNFKPLADWLKAFKPGKKQVGYAKMLNAKNADTMRLVSRLKGLEDDTLNEMGKEYKSMERGETSSVPQILLKLIQASDEYKAFEIADEKLEKVLKKYPLLNEVSHHSNCDDDVVTYVNAKHKTIK